VVVPSVMPSPFKSSLAIGMIRGSGIGSTWSSGESHSNAG
jgi:hypothetical protein